jgi:16S rRNA (guanine1516-N2)-methyltransferase
MSNSLPEPVSEVGSAAEPGPQDNLGPQGNPRIVVVGSADERCRLLAQQLLLPLIADSAELPADCTAWLGFSEGRLRLFPADPRQSGPIGVDFDDGAAWRRAQGGAELIVKAVRGRSKQPLQVLDATAGLGRDSFVLASRGFQVTAVERNAIVAALLADGLARAAASSAADIAARIDLRQADAIDYLSALPVADEPDVVYLDPMFPAAQKSALVKKEMRLFQQLLHGPADAALDARLLQAARDAARLRVVVKRPARAQPLAGAVPDYELPGKAIRFDVYIAG